MATNPKTIKKTTKNTKVEKRSWLEIQRDRTQKEFDSKAQELVWQITVGGSCKNLHFHDTLRSLEFIFLKLAAYTLGVRDEERGKE